jgi:hypothetical protein
VQICDPRVGALTYEHKYAGNTNINMLKEQFENSSGCTKYTGVQREARILRPRDVSCLSSPDVIDSTVNDAVAPSAMSLRVFVFLEPVAAD